MTKPVTVEFKFDDLEDYTDGFLIRVVHRALELVSFALRGGMVMEAPVKKGFLRGSIEEPVTLGTAHFGINIGAFYWEFIQFGTGLKGPKGRAYDIFPKTKKALRFVVGGQVVFAKFVKDHPGQKPNPFVDRAIDGLDQVVPGAVSQALEEAA